MTRGQAFRREKSRAAKEQTKARFKRMDWSEQAITERMVGLWAGTGFRPCSCPLCARDPRTKTLQERRSDENTKEFMASITEPHFGGVCNCDGCYQRCDDCDNYEPQWELSGHIVRGDGWVVGRV